MIDTDERRLRIAPLLVLAAALGLAGFGLAACDDSGPMEEAGEKMDEAADDAADAVEDAADEVGDALDDN